MNMHIPLVDLKAQHDSMRKELDETLKRVIDNSSFIMGEEVKKFESSFASYCGTKHCIGASNGSTALYAVLKVLGLKEGDEVIMPVNTFIATAFSATLMGGKPVFVDVNESDLQINTKLIEKAITPKTKVIIPVHLYGGVCDMDEIKRIADKHKLIILEDCAQAHGATYKGKKVPVYGLGCFSFFPAKVLGCLGDGGAIVCDNDEMAQKFRKFVNHGRIDKYLHDSEGFNFRLDALQSAVLEAKMKYLPGWVSKRRSLARIYSKELSKLGRQMNSIDVESCYYMYIIRTSNRDDLQKYLKEKGIETGIHYPVPLHVQPALTYLGYKDGDFPVAEKAAKDILSIPLYPEMTEEQQKLIISAINSFSN